MKKGNFIVFEGIECSGKSEQTKRLYNYYKERRIAVHKTREASDGPIGKLIREVYLSGKRKIDPKIINLLYVPDRFDHITNKEDGMLKFINEGVTVIGDRYYISSAGIHGTLFFDDSEIMEAEIIDIFSRNEVNMKLLQPDITFYIDTAPEIAKDRVAIRPDDESIFDNFEYMRKQHVTYDIAIKYVEEHYGQRVIRLDGNRSAEAIHQDVIKELKALNLL